MGSATRARQSSAGAATNLVDSLRKVARGTAAGASSSSESSNEPPPPTSSSYTTLPNHFNSSSKQMKRMNKGTHLGDNKMTMTMLRATTAVDIHSAVNGILKSRTKPSEYERRAAVIRTAAFSSHDLPPMGFVVDADTVVDKPDGCQHDCRAGHQKLSTPCFIQTD